MSSKSNKSDPEKSRSKRDYDSMKIKEERVYGRASAFSLFQARPDDIIRAFVRKGEEGYFKDILSTLAKKRVLYRLVTQEELFKISESEHHEGICLICKARNFDPLSRFFSVLDKEKSEMPILFLDGITNPHNIGGILRSAAYFGVRFVLIRSRSHIQLAGSLSRVSEGAVEHLIISRVTNLERVVEELRQRGFVFVVTEVIDSGDVKSSKSTPNKDSQIVLVMGNEQSGISKEVRDISDNSIHIQGSGLIESLNVSVATGIFLDRFFQMNCK
ncbi:MAG TPA: 23S rRNA (guanosine(2251)-2'-O)-methyltransferase RlmB [Oligoflexia bacterium]|nr:23S rRNA (guanosine(2251)-2'-O)-methyltransferase RlmB [Oligoflexia bacterium]HMP47635.1 23S rRNA (guanosine(2251)-2'-O)-methyltransferase RlmB [Oligoflexia bacterium]